MVEKKRRSKKNVERAEEDFFFYWRTGQEIMMRETANSELAVFIKRGLKSKGSEKKKKGKRWYLERGG